MIVSLIAAISENRVIGNENKLPWHLPEDLKRFKQVTLGHPILMGRKTYDSIGRVLPGRENIILSRQSGLQIPGATVRPSLEAALKHLESTDREIFVIGGAEIYRQALPRADRLYLTLVHQSVTGDAYFPPWEGLGFKELSRESKAEPVPFSFVLFERKPGTGSG